MHLVRRVLGQDVVQHRRAGATGVYAQLYLFARLVGFLVGDQFDIVEAGGNYGWRIREGMHDFDATVVPNPVVPLIDPIALTRYTLREFYGFKYEDLMQGLPQGAGQQVPMNIEQYAQLLGNARGMGLPQLPQGQGQGGGGQGAGAS